MPSSKAQCCGFFISESLLSTFLVPKISAKHVLKCLWVGFAIQAWSSDAAIPFQTTFWIPWLAHYLHEFRLTHFIFQTIWLNRPSQLRSLERRLSAWYSLALEQLLDGLVAIDCYGNIGVHVYSPVSLLSWNTLIFPIAHWKFSQLSCSYRFGTDDFQPRWDCCCLLSLIESCLAAIRGQAYNLIQFAK